MAILRLAEASSIFVIGAVLEHARELDVVKEPLLDGRLLEQVVDLFVCEAIAQRREDLAKILLAQESCHSPDRTDMPLRTQNGPHLRWRRRSIRTRFL